MIAAALSAGSAHRLTIGLIALVAAVGAIAGNNSVYWLGQHGGSRLVRRYGHWVRLDTRKLKVGQYLFAQHGRKIVFLRTAHHHTAYLRNVLRRTERDALLSLPYRQHRSQRDVAVACSFGAYALGSASTRVGTALMTGGLAAVGLLTIVVALVTDRTIRRLEERAAAAFPDPPRDSTWSTCSATLM